MIRLSKLADYGIVLLTYVARDVDGRVYTARELADESRLPLPTVSKILKALCRGGLLVSHRGASGGYSLARPARDISVVDIIAAIEGPIAMTECSVTAPSLCDFEAACPVRSNWQRINDVVVRALAGLTLVDMKQPLPNAPTPRQTDPLASGAASEGRKPGRARLTLVERTPR